MVVKRFGDGVPSRFSVFCVVYEREREKEREEAKNEKY
jgi:hypothetical protein